MTNRRDGGIIRENYGYGGIFSSEREVAAMARIYTSVDQLIGHTPLLELTRLEADLGLNARVLAKLEYLNPAGSVKDRVAKSMLDDAEAKGILKPDSVII